MKILLAASTTMELAGVISHLETHGSKASFFEYEYNGMHVFPLCTGVGSVNCAFSLSRYSGMKDVELMIFMGLAGSFNERVRIGDIVSVERERFADIGVEESDGGFTSVYDLELEDKNKFPFSDGWIINEPHNLTASMEQVRAITINTVSGNNDTIERRRSFYNPDIESMEGAAAFYAAKMMDVSCVQLRAISNMVEPRNRDKWEVELALDNLNKKVIGLLDKVSI